MSAYNLETAFMNSDSAVPPDENTGEVISLGICSYQTWGDRIEVAEEFSDGYHRPIGGFDYVEGGERGRGWHPDQPLLDYTGKEDVALGTTRHCRWWLFGKPPKKQKDPEEIRKREALKKAKKEASRKKWEAERIRKSRIITERILSQRT